MNMISDAYNKWRASKATAVVEARQTGFTINEFGDEGTVCFKDLERTYQSNKTPEGQKKNIENTVNLLKSKQVAVMTPNAERATKKALKPKLGIGEKICAVVAWIFNCPTKKRAHRMQNEMEYNFGRAAANMINLSYLKASNPENSGIRKAQEGIKDNLTKFFDWTDRFVGRFNLDKTEANATEKCENQVISRLVNSLVNSLKDEKGKISGDLSQLERLLDAAKNWRKPTSADEADGKINDRIDRIMNAIKTEVGARLEAIKAAERAEPPPPPTGLRGVVENVKNAVTSAVEKWRNSLKSTLINKTDELKKFCESIGGEMDVIKQAFERISDDLQSELNKRETDFNHKDLNEQAITDALASMDKHIGEAIKKGREIIDARLKKELVDHTNELQAKLFLGQDGYANVDVKKVNEQLTAMFRHTNATVEDVQRNILENPSRSLHYYADRFKEADKARAAALLQNTDLLSSKAITAVNKAIEQFSAARTALQKEIRPTLAKIELANQLEKKELQPPENVDLKDWQDACRALGKFIQRDDFNDLENLQDMPSSAVNLIKDHKEHFLEGLGGDAKNRLDRVLGYENLKMGFDLVELDYLGYGSKENVDSGFYMTSLFYDELLKNVNSLDEKVNSKDANDSAVDRSIKDSIFKSMTEELDDTFLAADSALRRTDVKDTEENRANGFFFDNDGGTKGWVSNEEAERVVTHLTKLIGKVDLYVAQKSAQYLEKKIADAGSKEKAAGALYQETKSDGASGIWSDEYSMERLRLIESAQEYLRPLVSAYRSARGIVAVNALERIRKDIQSIRSANPSDVETIKLCNAAESAIDKAYSESVITDGSVPTDSSAPRTVLPCCLGVGESVTALRALYDKIAKDGSSADGTSPAVDLDRFADNIDRLSFYGEHGDSVLSSNVGSVHLERTIKMMDNLTISHKRSRDIVDLVSNSLQSVTALMERIKKPSESNEYDSKWFKPRDLSVHQDSLRKNFSEYTKNMDEYVRTLMEDQLRPDPAKRQTAADNVHKSLAACYSSLVPIVSFLADYEVFVREKYVEHDARKKELETKVAAGAAKAYPGNEAMQAAYVEQERKNVAQSLAKEFPVCYQSRPAELFTEARTAIHNVFGAIGEISRFLSRSLGEAAAEDKLKITSAGAKLLHIDWGVVNEEITKRDISEREKLNDPVLNEAFNPQVETHGISLLARHQEARRIYRNEFNIDSRSRETNFKSWGFVFTDKIFREMNTMCLLLSNEKMKIARQPEPENKLKAFFKSKPGDATAVIKEIANLIAMRKYIESDQDLDEYLSNKVKSNAISADDYKKFKELFAGNDNMIVNQLVSLCSASKVFETHNAFGFVKNEQYAAFLNLYLGRAKVEAYTIASVEMVENAISRVAVKNRDGEQAYYTLNFDEKNKKIIFTPERSGKFRHFSVDESVEYKSDAINEKQTMNFPFEYKDNSFVVESPAQ